MVSIEDGQEFPQLQRVIEEISAIFDNAHDLTAIMHDQFDITDERGRIRRAQLMSYMVRNEMDRLAIKVRMLDGLAFPAQLARAA